ncbi:dipeptidyl aminopeptidase/acylaminoacyl peptidase [Lysobacter niastensis]|uniref:Dipeptidyl aminopeptidase/acylaminoacyl peptidase n=1 Tax=Lysobacter niastensis TaxID=380629 RepID=A0ABU1W915_9GAMM|nr:S9 family peptidase [Lysobacter niastensis]MDR7133840.1 dipeptidyl aminopeptidase/acylaminoacyl peptidase [Lysobacter niastensis]
MKQVMMAALLALSMTAHAAGVDVGAYVKKDQFTDIKVSPGGQYFAATVPLEDRTILAVIERSTNKLIGSFKLGEHTDINDFAWVTPERLVIGTSEKFGLLEEPELTGELYAMNADGSRLEMLVGQRVDDGGPGTTIKPKKGNDKVAAFLIDAVPAGKDARTVLISAQPYVDRNAPGRDVFTTVERIDLFTGRMQRVATVPVRNADFYLDNKGAVRFARGTSSDNVRKLFYRADNNADWDLITIEKGGLFETPVGFSADDKIAYLRVEMPSGPDAIVALDLVTRKRTEVLRDDDTNPGQIIYRNGTRIPIGAYFWDGKLRTAFFDPSAPEARLQHSLEAAFAGDGVVITSQTADSGLALVEVFSDRNPGDFYLFDTVAKKASHVLARRQWFDPEQQAQMQPITITARDGMKLHGYVTRPKGAGERPLPMVVMPHGGPYGIRDAWAFNDEGQLLAQAGYAVLQLNYRGSGGYGRSYESAGGREWGGEMQDDLTDATRWAITQGIADKSRICLYGASYGGYASLMGVAKEPSLYACAAGYVGVYDLPKMQTDDKRENVRVGNWSKEWVGDAASLGAVSPNRIADRIKVPVFLAAGGEDEIAPIEHSKMMEGALRKAGVPVETLYYDTEGHGFYKPEHQQEFYTRLLAFLSRSLGGGVAITGGGEAKNAK